MSLNIRVKMYGCLILAIANFSDVSWKSHFYDFDVVLKKKFCNIIFYTNIVNFSQNVSNYFGSLYMYSYQTYQRYVTLKEIP